MRLLRGLMRLRQPQNHPQFLQGHLLHGQTEEASPALALSILYSFCRGGRMLVAWGVMLRALEVMG